jgi:hypothetical protein
MKKVFAFDRTVSRLLEMQSVEYVRNCLEAHPQGRQLIAEVVPRLSPEKLADSEQLHPVLAKLWAHYRIGTADEEHHSQLARHDVMHRQCMRAMLADLAEWLAEGLPPDDKRVVSAAQALLVTAQTSGEYVSFRDFCSYVRQVFALFVTPHLQPHNETATTRIRD